MAKSKTVKVQQIASPIRRRHDQRETLVGFSELARTRADFASEFGISSGARRRDATGAFARIAAVEQVVEQMLSGRGPGEARAVDEIRSQFARARQHEAATTAALREALAAVFDKLNPEALEEQLGRRAQGAVGVELQARLWNRYRELFRATIQAGDSTSGPFEDVSESETVSSQTTFELDSTSARYLVLWITQLPPGGRATVSEVTATD